MTNSEKQILTDLAQRGFMDEVINLMVAYSLGRTRSTNVNREYISKLANDFAFKNIVTAEQGLLALRSGYDKKSQQQKLILRRKQMCRAGVIQIMIIKPVRLIRPSWMKLDVELWQN